MAGNSDNIRFTCSWCPGQVALIMLLSIMQNLPSSASLKSHSKACLEDSPEKHLECMILLCYNNDKLSTGV